MNTKKVNMVLLNECIDHEILRLLKDVKPLSPFEHIYVDTDIKDYYYTDKFFHFRIDVLMIDYVKRCKLPMRINISSGSIYKRVSDKNGGTWEHLLSHIDQEDKPCCIWVKSSYNDEEFLVINEYFVPLFYDRSSITKNDKMLENA